MTETINKNNSSIKLSYLVELVKKDEGAELQQNFIKVISLNGQEVRDPRMNKAVGSMAALPKFVFDSKGEMISIVDEDRYIQNFAKFNPDPKLKEMLKSPTYREILLTQSYQKWCYWVCLWTVEGLSESNPIETSEEIDFMGALLPQNNIVKHHGSLSDSSNLVKLSFLSITGFDNPLEFVENMSKEFNFKINVEPDEMKPQNGSKVVNVEAHIEEATLKPKKVIVTIKMSMNTSLGSQTKEEKHVFEFEWK